MTDDEVSRTWELGQLARHDIIAVVPEDRRTRRPFRPGAGTATARSRIGLRVSVCLSERRGQIFANAVEERAMALARAFYRVPMDHVFSLQRQPGATCVAARQRRGGDPRKTSPALAATLVLAAGRVSADSAVPCRALVAARPQIWVARSRRSPSTSQSQRRRHPG